MTPYGGIGLSTPSIGACDYPLQWMPYTIQPGDTLFRLARRFGLTSAELAAANCLADPNNITAGQYLYVPPGSSLTPAPPIVDTLTPAPPESYTAIGCANPLATITQPQPGAALSGTAAIVGSAMHDRFQYFRLQLSGAGTADADFATLLVSGVPVFSGQLGTINTALFAPGDYWLRLTVVDLAGTHLPACTVRVRFASQPAQ